MDQVQPLDDLNEAQKKAVTHGGGPLLIVAGAGTGKTTVLTRRYAHLLASEGLKTDNILALTFTEKAAGEMEDRVLKALPNGTYDFWISTFHGFCQRVLEAHGLEIGLPNQFRLLTPTDAWLLLKRRFAELPLDHYRPLGNPVKFLRALLQHISRAKDEGITPEAYLSFVTNAKLDGDTELINGERKRLQELADLYVAYRKMLLEEGCLDFGDLILETLRLFKERPATLAVYQKQFRFIMVDEFQDTNWAQYELIKMLAGKEKNLTVVGDDDQAIYKFRGASLANILQFRDDFPESVTVALTENYRSRKEILAMAYGFIKKNDPNRLEVRLKDTGLSKALVAMRGEGGDVEAFWKRRIEDEVEAVVEKIKTLKQQDPETGWSDFAILVRSNDGAEPFVWGLERHKIPFQFLALRGLYAKPVVLDTVALLSLCDGYHESSAVWRVMTLPCYLMPAKDMAELSQYANRKGISLWMAVEAAGNKLRETGVSEEGMRIAHSMAVHVDALAETARRETPLKIFQKALEETGYLAALVRRPEEERREHLQHLNAFADRMKRYEHATHGPSLRGFLEEFKAELESGEEGAMDMDPDAGPDMVKILTVHAAKGLEFKHVFVVSMVDQRFPSRARPEAIPLPDGLVQERLPEGDVHLEEERRLFYVAVTRAKDTLTVTGAENYGGVRSKKPSAFVAEASLELLQAADEDADAAKHLVPAEPVMSGPHGQPLAYYALKRRFSFTQLAAFRKCPLQYKFAHIYRIPILGSFQKSFGQSLHLVFQRMLELHLLRGQSVQVSLFDAAPSVPVLVETQNLASLPSASVETQNLASLPGSAWKGCGFRVSEEEAMAILEDAWIDEWYTSRAQHDEYQARGKRAVRNFWNACTEQPPDVVEVEKPFTLVLEKHSIKGKIDRMDKLPDGSVAVFDYKTGEAKETLDAEDKEQLYLYQIALEHMGVNVGRLAYIYVKDWVLRDVEPLDGKACEKFLEKITGRMDDIVSSDYQPTPEPFTCRFCDFRNICEFKKV